MPAEDLSMKFQLVDEYRYWWPAPVRVPDPENAGQLVKQELDLLFVPIPTDEAQLLEAEYRTLETIDARRAHENNLLIRVIAGWRGAVDDADEEIPFSEDVLRQALRFPWFRDGAYKAYWQSLSGDAARLGN
jgi:hypothetical protein